MRFTPISFQVGYRIGCRSLGVMAEAWARSLLELEDVISDQAVGCAVHGRCRVCGRRFDKAAHLAVFVIDPVTQITDVVSMSAGVGQAGTGQVPASVVTFHGVLASATIGAG
ncbi:MAG TPA: hypothetical protein VLW50_16195 [Streptosporangiaceae bacterium]|nr:hypothetical protein [Streptosporangiaceae bacterium]